MKKINLVFSVLLAVAIMFGSCKKDDNDPDPGNDMGSYTMTLDGNTFSTLEAEINMLNNGLSIAGLDHNASSFSFTLGNIPAVGVTEDICHENCPGDNVGLLFMGDIAVALVGWDGTVKRTAEKKIEINGRLASADGTLYDFSATINVHQIISK